MRVTHTRFVHATMMWTLVVLNAWHQIDGFLTPTKSLALHRYKCKPSPTSVPKILAIPVLYATVEKEGGITSASGPTDGSDVGVVPEDVKSEMNGKQRETTIHKLYTLPRTAYRIYTSYAKQLWADTNMSARKKIANDKVRTTIRETQNILISEYAEYSDVSNEARKRLLVACNEMLACLPKDPDEGNVSVAIDNQGQDDAGNALSLPINGASQNKNTNGDDASSSTTTSSLEVVADGGPSVAHSNSQKDAANELASVALKAYSATAKGADATAPKKKPRSVLFGAIMGAVVACWVFSGDYIFTGIFCLITILGQLEYYRMVMNTGVFPARRISLVGATSMFVTALFAPNLHQICLPMAGLWAMVWKLTMRRQIATIPEIATTFTGMFYLGYVPSFWVRTRLIADAAMEPTRLYPLTSAMRDMLYEHVGFVVPKSFIHLPITSGAIFIFWSWLSLAFSDVGAYFVGRKYGKTKLGTMSPAAGATSPNKSVEGVLGGCITSAILSVVGAWVQKWPYFFITGAIHGTMLGLLGLIGDLTASMLKRDAGLKDFGNLIPEHGGILDRVDSFVWTAPYSWLVCAYIIPALKGATTIPPI